jgi:hypothetical protein
LPNTPHGFPYPPASDPVAQGAAAIEALARAVDAGNFGTGTLKAAAYTAEGASNYPSFNIHELTAAKTVSMYIGSTGVFSFDFAGILGGLISADSTGAVKVMGQRVERHPYAADHHVESGVVSGSTVVTFTQAFTVAPSVVATYQSATSAPVSVGAPTLTGVQIFGPAGAIYWHAEGQG